jgi:polysaccharide deacetylase family protein (PEP-CTERM system associated)
MNYFLFSIDLEEVFFRLDEGVKIEKRVPEIMDRFLSFLNAEGVKITFFTVGDIAQEYPEVIARIVEEGHEIACHSHRHITVDKQNSKEFEEDLIQNITVLKQAGAKVIEGYRAPNFSINESRTWIYPILKKHGIKYSSSVLPAKNPLFGWEGFGEKPKMQEGVLEIPISVSSFLGKQLPFGGGIYFRVLPKFWIKSCFNKFKQAGKPVLGYMHPYDFDYEQPKIMHPGINNSKLYNFLMYYKRKNLYKRVSSFFSENKICTYKQFIEEYGV